LVGYFSILLNVLTEIFTPDIKNTDTLILFPPLQTLEIGSPYNQLCYPNTADFVSRLDPEKASLLTMAIREPTLEGLLAMVKRKLKSGQIEYGDNEFWGQVNQVTSHLFETAAYQHVLGELQAQNPDYFVSSPYYTKMMYGIDDVCKKLCGREWTEADFFVFERGDTQTFFVGAGEITGEINLGDKESEPFISPHKFKQLDHYRSGQVVADVFGNQSANTQRKMGRYVQGVFSNGGLSNHLIFDPSRYFSTIALPDEKDIPPAGIDKVIRVPLNSNDSFYTALSLIHEYTYAVDSREVELPLPDIEPFIIPLPRPQPYLTGALAAGD
jgi:hypothetical protein